MLYLPFLLSQDSRTQCHLGVGLLPTDKQMAPGRKRSSRCYKATEKISFVVGGIENHNYHCMCIVNNLNRMFAT